MNFSAEPGSTTREYTTDYITKAVGEGNIAAISCAEDLAHA